MINSTINDNLKGFAFDVLDTYKSNTAANHFYQVVPYEDVLMSLKSNSTLNEFGTDTVSIFNDSKNGQPANP